MSLSEKYVKAKFLRVAGIHKLKSKINSKREDAELKWILKKGLIVIIGVNKNNGASEKIVYKK